MENKGKKVMVHKKTHKKKLRVGRCILLGILLVCAIEIIVLCVVSLCDNDRVDASALSPSTGVEVLEPTQVSSPIERFVDPNNLVYPYSTMSSDWGYDVYADGYNYYSIPNSYAMGGGMFPEVAQVYLWCVCQETGVDYYMVLALIERESGYRWYATGDSGRSKGLMQIQERWHTERMEALGVEDLYNPYSNIRVGVNYLKELQDRYLESGGAHRVLMAYNMGASGARKLWEDGTYSTAYSTQILKRAQEIRQELQEQ